MIAHQLLDGTHTRNYGYDTLNRIVMQKNNDNYLRYNYGSNGELSYVTDSAAGTRTQYEYDLADRVVSVKEYNSEEPYLFDLDSSLEYTYVDETNQLKSIITKNGMSLSWYDLDLLEAAGSTIFFMNKRSETPHDTLITRRSWDASRSAMSYY